MKENDPEFPMTDRDKYFSGVTRFPIQYINEYTQRAFESETDIVVVFQERASWDLFRYACTDTTEMWVTDDLEETADEIIQRYKNKSTYSTIIEGNIGDRALKMSKKGDRYTFLPDSDVLYENE